MATTTTLRTLLERLSEEVWEGEYPILATCATNATAASVVVTPAIYSSESANKYDGLWVYVTYDAGGAAAAPEGESARVTSAGFAPTTGTFTVSPAFTAAVTASDQVLFLRNGFYIDDLIDSINDIVRNLLTPHWSPLTLVAGGDMEGAVTDWAAVGSPTTREMATTAAHTLLRQSLHLVANANAGATSANVLVTDVENLLVSVAVKVISGSYTVTLYDATNSAAIKSVTVDESDHTEVRFDEAVPSGCEAVTIRVVSAAAAAEIYVGWAIVLSQEHHRYALPSLVSDASEIKDVLYLPLGIQTANADNYVLDMKLRSASWRQFPRDWQHQNSNHIEVDRPYTWPLFLEFNAPGTVLSALTGTTTIPQELIVQGAAANCLKRLRDKSKSEAAVRKWEGRRREAARNYQMMLENYNLGRPEGRLWPQHRTPVA